MLSCIPDPAGCEAGGRLLAGRDPVLEACHPSGAVGDGSGIDPLEFPSDLTSQFSQLHSFYSNRMMPHQESTGAQDVQPGVQKNRWSPGSFNASQLA